MFYYSGELGLAIENKLRILMKDHDVGGHGINHMIAVANHATKALEHENIPQCDKIRIELAALLHDADDEKIFPGNKNYENARKILDEVLTDEYLQLSDHKEQYREYFINKIIEMIGLVSCSKNGDSEPPLKWMAVPRDSDRLEAIGQIGIDRCREFSASVNALSHCTDTPRVHTMEELWAVATPERLANYKVIKKSRSMIDHYYDKLLHVGKPECLRSQNPYILIEAAKRNNLMAQFVLDYWSQEQPKTKYVQL